MSELHLASARLIRRIALPNLPVTDLKPHFHSLREQHRFRLSARIGVVEREDLPTHLFSSFFCSNRSTVYADFKCLTDR